MSIWVKVGATTLGIGTAIGAGVAGYSHFTKESFKDKWGVSVLELTGETNQTQWEARLKELQNELNIEKQWEKLQKWCLENSANKFEKEDDTNYQNFGKFCTWKVGDKSWDGKIEANTPSNNEKWGTAHTKLKEKQENGLSDELKEIKKKDNSKSDNAEKIAMHKWCTENYKKTWTGDEDTTLKEVKDHCKDK